MKKVLLAFDGKHFSQGMFEFAKYLNEKQPVLLAGVFLPTIEFTEQLYSFGGVTGPIYFPELNLEENQGVEKNIEQLKTLCQKQGIEYRVHDAPVQHIIDELKKETRYADLLIAGSELFYENPGEDTQRDYLENLLHKAECPVIIVPEKYAVPESVILAYDGSEDSVYAIKQFAYLLPELTSLKSILVYASTENNVPDMSYIEELAARHFSDITFFRLEANPEKYFDTWLTDNKNTILVAGAYARNFLSEFLKKSFINKTMLEHKLPIFIAHK